MSEVQFCDGAPKWRMTATHHPGMQARFEILYHLFVREEAGRGVTASKKSFAEALGASGSKLSNWFKGQRPSVDTAISIADRFNLDLDWIYRGVANDISITRRGEIEEIAAKLGLKEQILLL